MKMDRNIQAGLITEISCQYDFSKFGIVLYAPITTDSRSDFIADLNGKLIKIQCKTSREAEDGNSFSFSTCSTNWNTKSIKTYKSYSGEYDEDLFSLCEVKALKSLGFKLTEEEQ